MQHALDGLDAGDSPMERIPDHYVCVVVRLRGDRDAQRVPSCPLPGNGLRQRRLRLLESRDQIVHLVLTFG